jgi:hypothetical protein
VSIERIYYCDGPDCERHVQTSRPRPPAFLTLTEASGHSLHFCGWDCVLKQAATKPPAEVVSFGAP